MVRLYSTRGLIISMIGLVAIQPLIWFFLLPFSYITNLNLYWASYIVWAVLGLVSGIKANNFRKGQRIYFLWALSLVLIYYYQDEALGSTRLVTSSTGAILYSSGRWRFR